VRGPTTWDEFKCMLPAVVAALPRGLFRSCIYRRGLGEAFHARWSETSAYKEALPRVKTYDIVKKAFRRTLVERGPEPPKTRALCGGYARWWLAHVRVNIVPTTPPPGPAGPCGSDGYENTCRVCGTGETKAHPVGTLLLCDAENCTAAWHTKCLGLRSVPSGNWECPCCAHAPRKKCMPQWPPVPKKGDKSGKKPAANYLAEDDSEGDTSGEE